MKIDPVHVSEAATVLDFARSVISTSVDAPDDSKIAFVQNFELNMGRWAKAPEQSIHLKTVESGNIVGVVLVRDYQNLCGLFVAPTYQRQGIGTALVRETIVQCRRKAVARSIRLNAAYNAVLFYEALGFKRALQSRPVNSAVPMEFGL